MRVCCIMSGGRGRRFWPVSRSTLPKQLVRIMDDRTLLGLTVERVLPLFGTGNVIVVTQKNQVANTERVLDAFGDIRILAEPYGRNTAACIGYAASWIESAVGEAVAAFLPADHFIADTEGFRNLLGAGMDFVSETGMLLTLGIAPDRPATGFGYIEKGPKVCGSGAFEFHRVSRFVEKPPLERARHYVDSGEYLWNAGIFVFKTSAILEEMRRYLPRMAARFDAWRAHFGKPDEDECLLDAYDEIEEIPIDTGVMERTGNAAVVPAEIGWEDVGSWDSFSRYMVKDEKGNAVHGPHVGLDSRDCIIYSDGRMIATVGLDGLAIVATGDAVLVMPRERGEEVKAVVDMLESNGLTHLL